MIKILKEGKIQKPIRIIYKKKCYKCDCEFEFETEDCEYIDKRMGERFYSIKCPFCKHTLFGSNINDLEHREEVEE